MVPFFSIHLLLHSTGFHRRPCYYKEIRLLHGRRPVVVASSGSTAHADPCRPPWVRCTECPAAAVPITAPTSVGFWASRSKARSPGRPGLLRASLSLGAAVRLGFLPHTASRRQKCRLSTQLCVQLPPARGCYQLAPQRTFTSNSVPMPGTPPCAALRSCSRFPAKPVVPFQPHRSRGPGKQDGACFPVRRDRGSRKKQRSEAEPIIFHHGRVGIAHRNVGANRGTV